MQTDFQLLKNNVHAKQKEWKMKPTQWSGSDINTNNGLHSVVFKT